MERSPSSNLLVKQFLKCLGINLALYLLLATLLFIYASSKGNFSFPNNFHFLRFDALLYQDIKDNGYHAHWLCAFFPAFPFFWKLLNISPVGIALVNGLIFIVSASILAVSYELNWKKQLFFSTIPSLIFMFVPYTESLFFFAGVVLLIGLKQKRTGLIIFSLLLESLIRPTTFVFIPALAGAFFLSSASIKDSLIKSIIPVLALIAGLFLTIYIHYSYTHKWFVFFEAQKLWENYLHFPGLPFRSWGGDASLRFDGSALAISICCGAWLILLFRKKLNSGLSVPIDFVFSLLYIFGTALVILLYRDGNLYSLNRFLYATPFLVVALNGIHGQYTFRWKDVWITALVSELFWLMFNSYTHIHNFLMFTTVTLYFILLLLSKHSNKFISAFSIFLLIAINSIGIIKLLFRYLNGGWIG